MVPEVLQGCPLQHWQGQEETFNMTNANDFDIHSTLLILRMREVFSVLLVSQFVCYRLLPPQKHFQDFSVTSDQIPLSSKETFGQTKHC